MAWCKQVPVADYSPHAGTFRAYCCALLKKLDVRNQKSTIKHGNYALHMLYSDNKELLFICITQTEFDQEVAFSFLTELLIQFNFEFKNEVESFSKGKSVPLPFELKRLFEPFLANVTHRYTQALAEGFSFKYTDTDTSLIPLDDGENGDESQPLHRKSKEYPRSLKNVQEPERARLKAEAARYSSEIYSHTSREKLSDEVQRSRTDNVTVSALSTSSGPSRLSNVDDSVRGGSGIVTMILDPKLRLKIPLLVQYTSRVATKKRVVQSTESSKIPQIFQKHPYLMIGLVFLLGLLCMLYFVVIVPLCGSAFQQRDQDGKRVCWFD